MSRALTAAVLLFAARPALAQSPDRLTELERRIDALSREVERLKLGEAAEPQAEPKAALKGLAPAASKVYRAQPNKVSIGGYGEMAYSAFSRTDQKANPSGARDTADFLRAVLYIGHKFNDWILFNSELEFEHATTANGGSRGEVSVEQAYLDFKLSEPLGVRAGLLLVPLGLTNEIHEPTAFHGVQRPAVERNVIPSTWRENGAGVYGDWGPLSYRSYVMTGLQAKSQTGVAGFNGATGIRGGRSSGAKSFAEDLAWASRVDVSPVEGLRAGAALYLGEADQSHVGLPAIPVTLWDLHATAEYRGLELKGLYVEGTVGNADSLANSVARRFFGGYAEAAFNVLSLTTSSHYLAPFFRYERYDTHLEMPAGQAKSPANSRVEHVLGLTYKPIPQVAIKTDYQWNRNQARTGVNQWNLGLAYIF